MASSPSAPVLAERTDIHKSCKSLETIVNAFNDYCRAADTLAIAQKKLAKSLREAAGLKGTGDIVVSAMTGVAGVFEAIAEVDTKFMRIADKECEGVTADLKKWFKKLAKEEKSHDDKIAAANAKIKLAGQAYERKAKKKDRDAADEHTRYVNILSVVGPEMSQEKYNHALFVTQRQTTAIYAVVSSLSRMADAEWMRACECVRRFSPVIGQIGEFRAFLEGGWTGTVPGDLPYTTTGPDRQHDLDQEKKEKQPSPEERRQNVSKASSTSTDGETSFASRPTNLPGQQTSPPTPNAALPRNAPSTIAPAPPSSFPLVTPRRPFAEEQDKNTSVRSIDSLSSFPSPPTHFPLPSVQPVASPSMSTSDTPQAPSYDPSSNTSMDMSHSLPNDRQTESPTEMTLALTEDNRSQTSPRTDLATPPTYTAASTTSKTDEKERSSVRPNIANTSHSEATNKDRDDGDENNKAAREGGPDIKISLQSSSREREPINEHAEYFRRERDNHQNQSDLRDSTPNMDATSPHGVERSDSVASKGSIVAAMRDRWSRSHANQLSAIQTGGPASPPLIPRDLPRLPQSVTNLATRYTPLDTLSTSPREQTVSVPDRELQRETQRQDRRPFPSTNTNSFTLASASTSASPSTAEDVARRRQRIEELEALELREHDQQLRERTREIEIREIEIRARELELEHARLLNSRVGLEAYTEDATRGLARTSPWPKPPPNPTPRYSQHSLSTTNLVASDRERERERPTSYYDRARAPQLQPNAPATARPADHAPFCGCRACSVVQYSSANNESPATSAHEARPPETPIRLRPEKPRGWMRRLSMPVVVGNAFSLDSKKNNGLNVATNFSATGRVGANSANMSMAVPAEDGRLIRRSFERDSTGGISNVSRPRKISFGRR